MDDIDLGELPKEGIARRECEGCGIMFTPRKPNHIYCTDCIFRMYAGGDYDEDDEELPEVKF